MEGGWPLVGRAAELERVERLLRAGSGGVVLAGPAGVGKTRLATDLLALAAERGFVPLRVGATQAASSLPLGTFAPLVPDLTGDLDRADMLRQVATAVIARGEGKPVALLVDDAHLLDESSAALTHHLAASQETFLLATVRSGEPASDAVLALWKDGLAERLELGPLSLTEVETLLAAVLGGPVDGATTRTFFDRSQGNVLFLKELVLGAAGVLREDGGLWRLDGRLPASARLVELIEARLTGLAEDDRAALEVLALGEPLGVDLLQGNVEGLERRGLLRIDKSRRRLEARLAHPLYGDILRARLSPLRARSVSRWLAGGLEAHGAQRREDTLRVATWQLDGGGELRPGLMLAAARQARTLLEFDLAERLTRAAVDAGAGFKAQLFLAEVLILQGRDEDAENLLVALAGCAGDDGERTRVALMRIDNFFLSMRGEEAMVALLEAEAAISDSARIDELTPKRALLAFFGGLTTVAGALVEPLLDRLSGAPMIEANFVAAYAFGLSGRTAAALEACERALAAQGDRDLLFPPSLHRSMQCRVLIWAGRLAEAEGLADRCYQDTITRAAVEPRSWFAQFLGECYHAQGRSETAIRWAAESVAIVRSLHQRQQRMYLRHWLLGLAAPLVAAGRIDEAVEVLAEIDALPATAWQAAEFIRVRAWVAVARDDLASAKHLLEEAAAAAARSGDLVYESAALHDLARLGHARQVVSRLSELGGVMEGPLARARADHAAALERGDPLALEAASVAFEEMPALVLAAEAAADAAVAWRKAGDPRKAAAAERRAHQLAARCEGAKTPALVAVTARAALTARELEIARLAAAGVPNKEIAERLYLSRATVENKLHAVYEKLGVAGRRDLSEALQGY